MDAIGHERWSPAFPWLTSRDLAARLCCLLKAAESLRRMKRYGVLIADMLALTA